VCYRLYTQSDYESRALFTPEEISRTDLSEVVLRMAELGIRDFHGFDFLTRPDARAVHAAVETLQLVDALEPDNSLSSIGSMMARFPLLPRLSRMIVEAIRRYPTVIEETVVAAAFLSANSPFLLPAGMEMEARRAHHRFRHAMGDFVSYISMLHAYRATGRKQAFCDRHFLDQRIMSEISNIVDQLSEIVGDMGVPVSGGGPTEDYLCAVARGLIQFVCVRVGRGAYRTSTAERIHIHPGSVMFRETPEFIVAGEIVRTSRMFARSVSALRKGWLERIQPGLSDRLAARDKLSRSGRARSSDRDTTWAISIAGKPFRLEPYKGRRKIAILPWDELEPLLPRLHGDMLERFRGLRGKLVIDGKQALVGVRLPHIVSTARHLSPRDDLSRSLPPEGSYEIPADEERLRDDLDAVLRLCPLRRQARSLGFVTLHTNQGRFWFSASKSFAHAVTESLAALEELADLTGEDLESASSDRMGALYRKLSTILEH
jgi:hypothetical protein